MFRIPTVYFPIIILLTVDALYSVPVMDHSSDFSVTFPVRRIESGVSTADATANTLDITIGNVIVFATPALGTSLANTHCFIKRKDVIPMLLVY